MTHVLFIVVVLSTIALCALGIVPSAAFVEVIKWTVIVYASLMAVGTLTAAGARVHEARSLRSGPPFDSCFPIGQAQVTSLGRELQIPWGSLEGSVFESPIGAGVPAEFTNFVRSPDAPPTMTDAGDGSEIEVPVEEFVGDITVPRYALDRIPPNRGIAERERRAREANAEPNIVVLGDDGEIPAKPTT